jgi:hypothetical protein
MNQQRMNENQESKRREPEPGEFVPTPGRTYRLRVLPRDMKEYLSPEGAADFTFMFRYHFSYVKEDGTKIYNIACPKTYGMDKKCPICDEGWRLYNSSSEEDKRLSKQFYRNDRGLISIVDLTDEAGVSKGVQWWKSPFTKVYQEVRKFVVNPQWAVNGKDVLDLESGRNFTVRVLSDKESGTGFQDYEIMPEPSPFDVRPYLVGDWESKVNTLVERRPKASTEDLMRLIAPAPGKAAGAAAGTPPPPGKPEEHMAASTEREIAPPPPPPPGSAASKGHAAPPPAAPGAAAPPPPPAKAKDEPVRQPVQEAPAASGDSPACFGKEYSLKNARCVKCKAADPDMAAKCRNKYLDS